MKKKILSAILCATTLFGAVGFSACEVTDVLFADYKEQIAELQETLNAQQEKIAYFEAEVAGLQETIDEQEEQIATFEQEKENLQGTIAKLQEEIEAFEQGVKGFVLKISMGKPVYTYGEEISVDIILENHNGEDVEIFYKEGFYGFGVPISDTGMFPAIDPPPPGYVPVTKKLLKKGERLRFTERIDDYFYPEYHELKYRVGFYLDEGLTLENHIEIYSNAIGFEIVV